MKTYFLFRRGKLVAVVQALDSVWVANNTLLGKMVILAFDNVVENPQDAEKQMAEWKREHQ